jgi:hypothetical protein
MVLVSCKENSKMSIEEQYPNPWREPNHEEFIEIGQTFLKNKVSGCGEYYIRPSSQNSNEYLVGCSSDGVVWKYYFVWPKIQNVMGPYIDTTIQKPS